MAFKEVSKKGILLLNPFENPFHRPRLGDLNKKALECCHVVDFPQLDFECGSYICSSRTINKSFFKSGTIWSRTSRFKVRLVGWHSIYVCFLYNTCTDIPCELLGVFVFERAKLCWRSISKQAWHVRQSGIFKCW